MDLSSTHDRAWQMSGDERRDLVRDDSDDHRFVIERDDAVAELVYALIGSRLILVHTEVVETLRNRGLAGQLVGAAVERAAAEGLTIVPRCPYVRRWLKRHPEAAATVAVEWPT
jgi:predicted GNAT family acetyltransferase